MKVKYFFAFTLVVIVFLFPQKIKADIELVSFYKIMEDGNLAWTSRALEFVGMFTKQEKAYIIFDNMFTEQCIYYIPKHTKILGISIYDDLIYITVSKEILNYGGTYYETCLRNQIIKTALNIPGINKVSLTIENIRDILSEGSIVNEEVKWVEIE